MRRIPLSILLAAGLLAVAPATAGTELTGAVLDAGGEPLAGADVLLLPVRSTFQTGLDDLAGRVAAAPAATASSDAAGSYRLQAPEPGLWTVRVAAPGYVAMDHRLQPLLDETALPPVRLREAEPLPVRVAAPDGRPVAGATVTSRPANWQFWSLSRARRAFWWPAPRRAVTAEGGTATVPRARGEEMELSAFAPGFAAAAATRPEGGSVTLRLTRGAPVAVLVAGTDGRPAAGALVLVGDDDWAAGLTADDGSFAAVVPEDRKLTAVAASGARGSAHAPAGGEPVRLTLAAPRRVSGRVLDARSREPLAGAFVWSGRDGDSFARTDRAGGFTVSLGEGDAGRYLQAAASGYIPHWLQLAESAELEPVLALEPTAAVAGTVVDTAREPVAGVAITARVRPDSRAPFRRSSGQQDSHAVSDADGRFVLRGLATGLPLTLAASREEFAPAELELPPLEPRENRRGLELVLGRGTALSGRVLGDGAPVAGAELGLEREPQGSTPWARMAHQEPAPLESTTGEDGSFAYRNLGAARYRLRVKARGFATLVVPGVEVAESGTDLGTLTLEPGVEIYGVVVDADGRPLAGADLRVAARQSGLTIRRGQEADMLPAAVSADDGSFRLTDRPRGERVDLHATLVGYAAGMATAVEAPNDAEIRIVLQRVARISGEVVGPDGAPVAGAQVTATLEDGGVSGAGSRFFSSSMTAHARADAEGRFELDSVPPGKVRVGATAPGWRQGEHNVLELPAGGELEGLRLELRRGATVTGQVLRADGLPAAGVMVRVEEGRAMMMSMPVMVLAGGDGRYALEGVEPGNRMIVAQDEDQNRAAREIEVAAGVNRLDLQFGGGHEISGRVADEAAAPLAGASVSLHSSVRSWQGRETRAGEDGSFSFAEVPDGDYLLRASHPGYASYAPTEPLRVAGAALTGIEIQLPRGGSISGRVRGLEANQLAGVQVMAMTMNRQFTVGQVSHDGSYRITEVGPGEWQIRAMLDDRQAGATAILEPGALDAVVDLEFGAGLTLSGQLLSAGEPLPGLAVVASGMDALTWAGGQSDHQGRFRLAGLEPGRLSLVVSDFRSGLRHQQEVDLAGDRDIVIEIASGRISGRVLDGGDLRPLSGARVGLAPLGDGDAAFSFTPLDMSGGTDGEGRFVIPRAAAGEQRLRVVKEGYAPAERTVSVAPGSELADLEIVLEPTGGLRLAVVGPSGAPPSEIQYAVLDDAGRAVTSGSRPIDSVGQVRLPSVPTGRFELLVAASGAAVARLAVEAPGPVVPVALEPSGRLEVAVAALEDGDSLAKLQLTAPDGRPFLGMAWGSAIQREWHLLSGRVTIEGLPPGRFEVMVTAPDGRQWRGAAAVARGQLSRLTL